MTYDVGLEKVTYDVVEEKVTCGASLGKVTYDEKANAIFASLERVIYDTIVIAI